MKKKIWRLFRDDAVPFRHLERGAPRPSLIGIYQRHNGKFESLGGVYRHHLDGIRILVGGVRLLLRALGGGRREQVFRAALQRFPLRAFVLLRKLGEIDDIGVHAPPPQTAVVFQERGFPQYFEDHGGYS